MRRRRRGAYHKGRRQFVARTNHRRLPRKLPLFTHRGWAAQVCFRRSARSCSLLIPLALASTVIDNWRFSQRSRFARSASGSHVLRTCNLYLHVSIVFQKRKKRQEERNSIAVVVRSLKKKKTSSSGFRLCFVFYPPSPKVPIC